jgi:hypothetical protein
MSRLTRYAIVVLQLAMRSIVLVVVWFLDTTGAHPLVPGLAKPTVVNVTTVILVLCLFSARDIAWRLRAEAAADLKWSFGRMLRGEIVGGILLVLTVVLYAIHSIH